MLLERIKFRLSGLLGEDARAIIPRLLLTDGRRYAWRYALAFLFMALVAASTAFSAYLMKDVINKIFVEGRGLPTAHRVGGFEQDTPSGLEFTP